MSTNENERAWLLQDEWNSRFEWGPTGAEIVTAEAVVVIDVLRFTTTVDAAVSRGATVFPYRWRDSSMHQFAREVDAHLADPASSNGLTLSPLSMFDLGANDRVVLPSPNGSTCAVVAQAAGAMVYAACLRNATAVGQWMRGHHKSVTVVACGERWPDGSLRPSLEDYLGAGAVLSAIGGNLSPEAQMAVQAWQAAQETIAEVIAGCVSGREALARGWRNDLDFACQVNVSRSVPGLRRGGFIDFTLGPR